MSMLSRHLQSSLKGRYNLIRRYQQTQPKLEVKLPPVAGLPLFKTVQNFPDKIALRDSISNYTFANLFISANELSQKISSLVGGKTNEKVLFLCPNDVNYVITLWGIWMSGQIAVPLSPRHPQNILLYHASDTQSKLMITTPQYVDVMQRVAKNTHSTLHVLDDKTNLNTAQKNPSTLADLEAGQPGDFYEKNNAMILYTSGTTGSPKGVVLSHKNLLSQVTTLVDAWKWSSNDVILHTLPLHHVHGIVNALLCPLYIGAKTFMLEKFDANTVWSHLLAVNAPPELRKITVYMAIATAYAKLIDEYERVLCSDEKMVGYIKNTLKTRLRLMVSGSAPLPTHIYKKWLELSGHRLLERYGLQETGMALAAQYDSQRDPGFVGVPLPGVSVRVADETNTDSTILECTNDNGQISYSKLPGSDKNPTGEILIKGTGVFKEYLNRPEATKNEFTKDGWFKTSDICEYSLEKKQFKILGRKNIDIIKSDGVKISAIQVESALIAHPDIKECVVVGVPDEKQGERVAAVVVLKKDKELTLEGLTEWAKDNVPRNALPTTLKVVSSLPKNAMGKVNKKELIKFLF